MKKMVLVGRIVDGYRVSIEKGNKYYVVEVDKKGSYECYGMLETLKQAKEKYNEVIKEIIKQKEWEIKNELR